MTAMRIRVVNQQVLPRSLLIDKVDHSQGNFSGYAQRAKRKVYVPYVSVNDSTVKGYLDMVPTDEVLLALNTSHGVLAKLVTRGYITATPFAASLILAPVVSAATHAASTNVGGGGSAATISAFSGGKTTLTGLTGLVNPTSIGHDLTISGCATSANNGTFKITNYISATSCQIANPAGVFPDANSTAIVWQEKTEARVTITGTTLTSLSPDKTYVTLTNPGHVSVVITDAALIAAGSPAVVSATSFVIPDTFITNSGPLTTGWTVTIKANGQTSNVFPVP